MALKEVPGWRRWLGRSRRLEFWVCVVALFVANAVAIPVIKQPVLVSLGSLFVWLPIATRRLNDMRARWWWAWVPFGTGFFVAFAAGVVRGATHGLWEIPPASRLLIEALGSLGTALYLGLTPGKRSANEASAKTSAVDLSTFD